MSSVSNPATTTSPLVSPLAAGPVIGQDALDTVGFYGSAGTAKPTITGARDDGTALASLLTALADMGLVVDESTPT